MEPYSSDDIKRKKRKNDDILKKLFGALPEVISAVIVSAEGLPIAYMLPQGVDETRVAAMTSALLSLSERAIIEMRKGDFDQLYIKGSNGYLLVMQIGLNAILLVSTTKEVRLGLILLDCRRICEKISKLHDGFDGDYFDDDDEDGYFPYPYIFKPPEPPGDLKGAPQLQPHAPRKVKDTEEDIYCQYCGRKLTKEERFSHNCRKSPE